MRASFKPGQIGKVAVTVEKDGALQEPPANK
jgi:hypothetical protein